MNIAVGEQMCGLRVYHAEMASTTSLYSLGETGDRVETKVDIQAANNACTFAHLRNQYCIHQALHTSLTLYKERVQTLLLTCEPTEPALASCG